jgi:hypothetical protein
LARSAIAWLASCSSVPAHQTRARIAAPDSSGQHHAADAVDIGRIVGRRKFLEHTRLRSLVRGRAVSLGHVERDLAGRECLEHHGRKVGEAQPAFDETQGEPETARHIFGARAVGDQAGKCLRFVGRVHRQAVEVLGQARLVAALARGLEYQAGHFVIARQQLLVGEGLHGPATAATGIDLEPTLGGWSHDQVLQQAMGRDAGFQFDIGCRIGMTTDIARGLDEFAERDCLEHGTCS